MKIEMSCGTKVELSLSSDVKLVFTPPTLESYTKEEFEEVLDASACGSVAGSTFSCSPCYMGTYVSLGG